MRNVLFALAATCVSTSAFAVSPNDSWSTEASEVEFKTENAQLFKGQGYTMWLPDAESAVRVKLTVDTDAMLDLTLLGDAALTGQQTELEHAWTGLTDGGNANVDVRTDILFDAYVDFGSFVWSNRVWGQSFNWSGASTFDSLLIAGGSMLGNVAITPTDFVDVGFEVPLDTDLVFSFDGRIAPDFSAALTGTNIVTNDAAVTFQGEQAAVETPDTNRGTMPVDAQWRGTATSTFGLDITLEVGACYDSWGCISTGDFLTYPWQLQQGEVALLATSHFDHALPAVDVRTTTIDLGDIEVGDSDSVDITIRDLGDVKLVGQVEVDGEGFDVVTSTFTATQDDDAVITVVFTPEDEGSSVGTITLHTNDPVRPEVVVPVRGEGFVIETPVVDEPGDDTSDPVGLEPGDEVAGGCGCSSQPGNASGAVGLIGLAILLARRARR